LDTPFSERYINLNLNRIFPELTRRIKSVYVTFNWTWQWFTRSSSAGETLNVSSHIFYLSTCNVRGFLVVHFVFQATPQMKVT
jgi:hypothetical protein